MIEADIYLVIDTETELLAISSIDWNLFNFQPKEPDIPVFDELPFGIKVSDIENDINRSVAQQEFLKEQIQKEFPNGVIVSTPRLKGGFYYNEWDAYNILKFEIHSDFSEELTYLKLIITSKPIIDALNQFVYDLMHNVAPRLIYEEMFEPTKEGWIKLYQRVVELQNSFVNLVNSEKYDNTPYYNIKNQWDR